MPDSVGQNPRRVIAAAGTETYECAEFTHLKQVPMAVQTVVSALAEIGVSTPSDIMPSYLLNPRRDQLRDHICDAARAADVVIVYYTGHGVKPAGDEYYVITADSKTPLAQTESEFTPRALVKQLSRWDDDGNLADDQPQVLLILDCCYSGNAGPETLAASLEGVGNPHTWVIASASKTEWAEQAVFATALAEALRKPTTGPSQRHLSLNVVVQAVNETLTGSHEQIARYWPPSTGSTGVPPFFPNRSHMPKVAGLTVSEQHWLAKLRGAPEVAMTGFYITGHTGRITAVEDLARWITAPAPGGVAVVTGSPGSGKSALLALPVLLAQPGVRADLLREVRPDGTSEGSIIARAAQVLPPDVRLVSVHARGLNVDQVAYAVSVGLDRQSNTASELLKDLSADPLGDGPVVIVDATDEATAPTDLINGLLLPLARQHRIPVVLGGRRHVMPSGEAQDQFIDLDQSRYSDPDALVDYITHLLGAIREPGVDTPYRDSKSANTKEVAGSIAHLATTNDHIESFLIGRVLAITIRSRPHRVDVTNPRWMDGLPSTLGEAFDEDLARIGPDTGKTYALLQALAWAKGPGLPWETIWAPVARALQTGDGQAITDDDIRELLDHAGAYIVEDIGPGNRSVYRPFHDQLATYLREITTTDAGQTTDQVDATIQQRITSAIFDTLTSTSVSTVSEGGRRWDQAHPYVRTYLSEHAAAGGRERLIEFLADIGFLSVADPATLIPLLNQVKIDRPEIVKAYRRAHPLLAQDISANVAYLQEAINANSDFSQQSQSSIEPMYRTKIAETMPDGSILTLPLAQIGYTQFHSDPTSMGIQ